MVLRGWKGGKDILSGNFSKKRGERNIPHSEKALRQKEVKEAGVAGAQGAVRGVEPREGREAGGPSPVS